jgi:hypothetical protein
METSCKATTAPKLLLMEAARKAARDGMELPRLPPPEISTVT